MLLGPDDERLAFAQQKRQALEPRVPKLRLRLAAGSPPDTVVRAGNAELRRGSFGVALPMDPGSHELVVIAPDREPKTIVVRLSEGKTLEIEVEVGPATARPSRRQPAARKLAPSTAPTSVRADEARPPGDNRTLGYLLGGVGLAGLIAGGLTGVMVLEEKSVADDHCSDTLELCDQTGKEANDSGRLLGVVTTAALAVGVAGVGAGAYFILSRPGSSETALVTRASFAGAELSLTRRW